MNERQRPEDRGRRTEGRGQRSDVRGQNGLEGPLGKLRTRVFALAVLRGVGLAAAILIGCIVTGWADLIVALPSAVRIILVGGCILAAVGALVSVIVAVRNQVTARRLAAALDKVGETGGQIQAGVELAEASGSANPLTADLQRRAIDLSSELATKQNLATARPAAPALRPYICVGAVLLLLGLAWLAWPGLVTAQAARVFDPRTERAPRSPYTFVITPSAPAIIYGDPFEVSVRVSGNEPRERFEWVIDQPGRSAWRLPLLARSDGVMLGNIASVLSDFSFRVEGPRGKSESVRIAAITVPEIRDTAVKLVFPEYTHLAPFEGPMQEGGPSGVRGTRVTLLIASNRPLSGGSIEIRNSVPNAAPLTVEMKTQSEPNVVAGTFEITGDLRFSALIRDVHGTPAKAPLQGRCLMLPDQPPRVAIREPRAKSFATPDISLPTIIETEDDFGISEILLYRSLNGSREIPLKVPVVGTGQHVSRHEVSLPLNQWGLEPGDVLELSALARDTDPAGAKTAQTPVHRITIINKEQYLEMLREQETIDDLNERYKPWLQQLVALRKQWELAHKKNDPKEIEAVKQVLRDAVEQLEQQLKEPPVFSADLQMAKELKELQESLRQALEDLDKADYDAVDNRLADTEKEAAKKIERPLELLTKLYHLIEDQELFTMLAQVQEDMAHRTARFEKIAQAAEAQEQRDLKALGDEERQIQSSLEQLVQDIRDHAGKLPKDDESLKKLIDTANEFATKVHDLEIEKMLGNAAGSMEKFAGTDSRTYATQAAGAMMGLVEKGGGGMGGGAMDELEKFSPTLANTAKQMLKGKGLGNGAGNSNGKGGRGGYSMSGGSNAGVYGNRQRKLSKSGSGGGKQGGGGGPASGQKLDDAEGFGHIDTLDDGKSGGVPLSAIPSKYRSAVRDFNRRIADEKVGK